jgi:hypothetical protein
MQAVRVRHYLNRARDFLEAMNLLRDDVAAYGYSSALVAIHGSIAYADALRFGLGGTELSSDDHRSATRELQQRLTARKYEKLAGVTRLARLLSDKSEVAYGSNPVAVTTFKSIIQQAERFAAWAEQTGRELRIEGWRDE